MRLAFVVFAFLLASCGGRHPQASLIKGEWRSTTTGPDVNRIDLTISQDGKTVTGIADVQEVIYEFDGRWTGSFGPDDLLRLELKLADVEGSVSGSGTLSTGAEDADIIVAGSRTGRSFQLSVNPAAGEALRVSGHFEYGLRGILLTIEIDNIPGGLQGGERRDLQLTLDGKRSGGFLNLLPSASGSTPQ